MKEYSYKTISSKSTGEFKDRGSKFIGYVFPFNKLEDLNDFINQLKLEHPSARHFCYAYRLGVQPNEQYRMNDDGEPSNSAGAPIYGQLQSFDVTNCLIVVIRYFGGVKLGVGGLINAYREAAKIAIENNTIVEKLITNQFSISFPYDQTSFIEQIINKYKLEIVKQEFSEKCDWIIQVPIKHQEEIMELMKNNQLVSIELIGE